MRCPYCGGDNRNNVELCSFCGSYIAKPEGKTVINQTIYVNKTEDVQTRVDNEQSVSVPVLKHKKPIYKKWWFWLIVVIFVFGIVGGITKKDKSSDENNSVWASSYTEIDDFDYYLDGNEIFIKDYKGTDDKVRINDTYKIDGKERKVVSFNDAVFFASSVDSVILPNGTKYITSNMFNCSGIKYLYIPKSIKSVENTFWGYFHDMEKIYYGGTETEWKELCKAERSDVDVKEIVFNADSSKLK